MRARARLAATLAALTCALPRPAAAQARGLLELSHELRDTFQPGYEDPLVLDGYLRARAASHTNFDLDRGLTPSGQPLYPVPLADPRGQTLYGADLRLRLDLAISAPSSGFSVKLRTDVLDNVAAGSTPEGKPQSRLAATPAATTTQRPPADAFRIKRAYGEARTPIGLLAVGRQGNHWGLGMLAHGGDCETCDSGDAADRIAFVTPLAQHVWALAFDISASGPYVRRARPARVIDVDPGDDVRSLTFAFGNFPDELAVARRADAGRATVIYGAYASYRWQSNDVPADYLLLDAPVAIDAAQSMARAYRAAAFDAWGKLVLSWLRVEAEAALLVARADEPSLIPGVLYRQPLTSRQIGAALESDVQLGEAFQVGVDAGFASGDPAPGFGAFPEPNARRAAAGELEAAQAYPPYDRRVDNFRFHPDYQIDRILFREIIGTVTDAWYVRPHARWSLSRGGAGELSASLAAVTSAAVQASSTPSGEAPLGVELDPTLRWENRDGFRATLDYAVLFPLAGLDNLVDDLPARPAHLVELRLAFVF